MDAKLLTSAQAAELLGVGPTTVKRWADAGLIACVKTAGKHRRFPRAEVERLLGAPPEPMKSAITVVSAPEVASWIKRLTGDATAHEVQAALLAARAQAVGWWQVADSFDPVLRAMGELWSSGQLSVLEEHLASERLARALAATAQSLPTPRGAPKALLAVPEGEEHTLGLSLAELVLREAGWAAPWAGRRTPIAEISGSVRAGQLDAVALSASVMLSAKQLARQAEQLSEACRAAGIPLLLGGEGAWPERLRGAHRLHRFSQLQQLLRNLH
jgi:MerR family transcriptional regulator, light-induced transcriptional regulator